MQGMPCYPRVLLPPYGLRSLSRSPHPPQSPRDTAARGAPHVHAARPALAPPRRHVPGRHPSTGGAIEREPPLSIRGFHSMGEVVVLTDLGEQLRLRTHDRTSCPSRGSRSEAVHREVLPLVVCKGTGGRENPCPWSSRHRRSRGRCSAARQSHWVAGGPPVRFPVLLITASSHIGWLAGLTGEVSGSSPEVRFPPAY